MRRIELPCFFENEETETLGTIGKPYPLSQCSVKNISFIDIAYIEPYIDEEEQKEYTLIGSNGGDVICAIPYRETCKRIDKHQAMQFLTNT